MKKCTKCGKECVNEHKYCPECGTELKEVLMEYQDQLLNHYKKQNEELWKHKDLNTSNLEK